MITSETTLDSRWEGAAGQAALADLVRSKIVEERAERFELWGATNTSGKGGFVADPQALRFVGYSLTPVFVQAYVAVRDHFDRALEECGQPDWDGYGALPARQELIPRALEVAKMCPPELGVPDCSFDADGSPYLEWSQGADRILTLIIEPEDELIYAGRIDGTSFSGSCPVSGDLPKEVRDGMRMLTSDAVSP